MDGAVIVKVVIMALILVLVIVTICTCNKFMVLKTRAENQASQIDIQLARRADLIPNLVEIVKGYAKHEKETLMTVVELRNRMTLADISYQENEFGREEIKDGTKYVYSDAYGLTGTDTFLVYMEGTPVSEISEEAYSWLSMANKSDTELTMVALVNEGQEEGIYSYKKLSPLEDAQTTFESYKSSYEYWTDEIDKAESQSEINDDSQKRYEVMDECLNYIWNLIKNDTDENAYQKILEEQRTWIADKEAKAKAASDEYGDGSAGTAAYYDKSAELTMTRCEELIEYLK